MHLVVATRSVSRSATRNCSASSATAASCSSSPPQLAISTLDAANRSLEVQKAELRRKAHMQDLGMHAHSVVWCAQWPFATIDVSHHKQLLCKLFRSCRLRYMQRRVHIVKRAKLIKLMAETRMNKRRDLSDQSTSREKKQAVCVHVSLLRGSFPSRFQHAHTSADAIDVGEWLAVCKTKVPDSDFHFTSMFRLFI